MAMDIAINTASPEPVYEQIVRQVHDAVKAGRLEPGTPLPPVRQRAGDLSLNRNTIARAYKILEDQGVILTAGRKGTFVRQGAQDEVARARTGRAERVLRRVIRTMLVDGLSRKEIAEIFTSALNLESRKG
jgi:DNA-binding transcriptional regulator YhcF (GntR family)